MLLERHQSQGVLCTLRDISVVEDPLEKAIREFQGKPTPWLLVCLWRELVGRSFVGGERCISTKGGIATELRPAKVLLSKYPVDHIIEFLLSCETGYNLSLYRIVERMASGEVGHTGAETANLHARSGSTLGTPEEGGGTF